jgi:hypothetical protein
MRAIWRGVKALVINFRSRECRGASIAMMDCVASAIAGGRTSNVTPPNRESEE